MYQEKIFPSKEAFHKWLKENHDTCDGLWLIFSKTDKLFTITYDQALEEALCFGWIDGQIYRIDDTKYKRKFTPRRKRSIWSERNMKIVAQLIKQDRMTASGYAAIERAKKEGMWDAPTAKPISDEQVEVLIHALGGTQPALDNFMKMSPSVKRTYTGFYLDAKKEETKTRRLKRIIERLNENLKPM